MDVGLDVHECVLTWVVRVCVCAGVLVRFVHGHMAACLAKHTHVCMYVYIYIYIYIYVCVCLWVHAHAIPYAHTAMDRCIYTSIGVDMLYAEYGFFCYVAHIVR